MIPDKDMRTTIRVYRKGGCVKVCTVLQKINNKIKGEREEKKIEKSVKESIIY